VARRVFFSFHFDRDIWRANQVRNCNVVHGVEVAGYFDHSEYQDAKQRGDSAIRDMIDRHLSGTSVTVVLIGAETAYRPWVKYEVEQSIKRDNALVGIQISHLKNVYGLTDTQGPAPSVPWGTEFPVHRWANSATWFSLLIEEAGQRADKLRARTPLAKLLGL
jgi:hypothetical protein